MNESYTELFDYYWFTKTNICSYFQSIPTVTFNIFWVEKYFAYLQKASKIQAVWKPFTKGYIGPYLFARLFINEDLLFTESWN